MRGAKRLDGNMGETIQPPLRGSKPTYQAGRYALWSMHRECNTVPWVHHVRAFWGVTFDGCTWFADDPSESVKMVKILRWYQL